MIATTAIPTRPPTRASIMRSGPPLPPGGISVATSTAEFPACMEKIGPLLRSTATDIASTTTKLICHGPLPIPEMIRSPIPIPTVTPATNSNERRSRAPNDRPSETTAAIGAKNGAWCPITVVATHHANPAAKAH